MFNGVVYYADTGPSATETDGSAALITIDLAQGDDTLVFKDQPRKNDMTTYLGEGNDVLLLPSMYYLGHDGYKPVAEDLKLSVFAESGDDKVIIMDPVRDNNSASNLYGGVYSDYDGSYIDSSHFSKLLYLGSGSDFLYINNFDQGYIDLGSGKPMPAEYLATYQDGSGTSLGNDNNTDLATDTNHMVVTGEFRGFVYGGDGVDILDINRFHFGAYYGSVIDLGAGNDTLNVTQGGNIGVIYMGEGEDTVTIDRLFGVDDTGSSMYPAENGRVVTLDMGSGNDRVIVREDIGGDFSSTVAADIKLGEGDDILYAKEFNSHGYKFSTAYLNGEEGFDVLKFNDLTSITQMQISNVELLVGGEPGIDNINYQYAADGTRLLFIGQEGNATVDFVTDSNVTQNSNVVVNGKTYQSYNYTDNGVVTKVYIEEGVTIL